MRSYNWVYVCFNQHEYDYVVRSILFVSTRFKDGLLISSDVVGGEGNSGSTYEIASLNADDVGQYACRAVSLGGKIFSRSATLVVKGT